MTGLRYEPPMFPCLRCSRWLRRENRELPADYARVKLHSSALPPAILNGKSMIPEAQPVYRR